LKRKIEQFKYHSDRHISTELVEVLSKCVEVSNFYPWFTNWEIVPVPMHWTRYFFRRFDHTKLLATQLWKILGLPVHRVLGTFFRLRQAKLSRDKRIRNKKNSFFVKNGYTVPSHIILIDDVLSSGATINEAARTLRYGWAEIIICFTLASNANLCPTLSKSSELKHTISKMWTSKYQKTNSL
jgi:ComF family protein